jgi:hypothetical protein
MNKQTALQWLKEKLPSLFIDDNNGFYSKLFEEALQMEREQIEDAFKHGQNNGFMYHERGFDTISSNQFYKQTYERKDE